MIFAQLNKLKSYWFFPTMEALWFFDATTGEKIAEWRLNCPHNVEWRRWSFYCVVNTLPDTVDYQQVVTWWKLYVDARCREAYSH